MKPHFKLYAGIVTAALALALSPSVHAGTIGALLNGNDLQLEYANGAVVIVSFNTDGTYKTSTGSSGKWTLQGAQLCTIRNSDGVSGCGRLPVDKLPGAVWTSTDANGVQVTARIVRRR